MSLSQTHKYLPLDPSHRQRLDIAFHGRHRRLKICQRSSKVGLPLPDMSGF